MDSSGRVIFITEDDMGEGFFNPIEEGNPFTGMSGIEKPIKHNNNHRLKAVEYRPNKPKIDRKKRNRRNKIAAKSRKLNRRR